MALKWRLSLQGCEELSAFMTMCRGDAQGLVEHLTTPATSRARNSAISSFSVSCHSNAKATGGHG